MVFSGHRVIVDDHDGDAGFLKKRHALRVVPEFRDAREKNVRFQSEDFLGI